MLKEIIAIVLGVALVASILIFVISYITQRSAENYVKRESAMIECVKAGGRVMLQYGQGHCIDK